MKPAQTWRVVAALHGVGVVLLVVGHFGAWIPHRAVALLVTGRELSEFAKFFPQVQGGAVPIERTLFLMPLATGAVLLAIWVHTYWRWGVPRLLGTGLALLLAAATAPPLQFLTDPSYRGQLALVAVAALLVLATIPVRRASARLHGLLILALALAGMPLAMWQFRLLHPLVKALYNQPVAPGWGLVLDGVGFVVLLVAGVLGLVRGRAAQQGR